MAALLKLVGIGAVAYGLRRWGVTLLTRATGTWMGAPNG